MTDEGKCIICPVLKNLKSTFTIPYVRVRILKVLGTYLEKSIMHIHFAPHQTFKLPNTNWIQYQEPTISY